MSSKAKYRYHVPGGTYTEPRKHFNEKNERYQIAIYQQANGFTVCLWLDHFLAGDTPTTVVHHASRAAYDSLRGQTFESAHQILTQEGFERIVTI